MVDRDRRGSQFCRVTAPVVVGADQLSAISSVRVDWNLHSVHLPHFRIMLVSTFALALLGGSAVAQFPFTGKHKTAKCLAVNRATDETMAIELRKLQPKKYRPSL